MITLLIIFVYWKNPYIERIDDYRKRNITINNGITIWRLERECKDWYDFRNKLLIGSIVLDLFLLGFLK